MFGLDAETMAAYGLSAVTALVVMLAGLIVSGWASGALRRVADRTELDPTLSRFFSKMARWAIMMVTALFVLGEFGVETASLSVVLGAVGLAIGLALQGTLSNFASGVMLLLFRPFKVGDAIRAAGETGIVYEIDLFTTSIDTFDNRRLILPNGKIFGDTIENITFHEKRRADVAVGVEYSADIAETRRVLEGVFTRVDGLLSDPEPTVFLTGLGASSVDWELRGWASREDFLKVKQDLTAAAKSALDHAGIGIPFPQMDVHLDGRLEDAKRG